MSGGIQFIVMDPEKCTAKRVCMECGSEAEGYHYSLQDDGTLEIGIPVEHETILMRHKQDCRTGEADAMYLGCTPK